MKIYRGKLVFLGAYVTEENKKETNYGLDLNLKIYYIL